MNPVVARGSAGLPFVRVLVIEDNPGDARLVQEMLSDVPGAMFKV